MAWQRLNEWRRILRIARLRGATILSAHRIWQGTAVAILSALLAWKFLSGEPQTIRRIVSLALVIGLTWVIVWLGTFLVQLVIVIPELTREHLDDPKTAPGVKAANRLAEAMEENNRLEEAKRLDNGSPLRAAIKRARESNG